MAKFKIGDIVCYSDAGKHDIFRNLLRNGVEIMNVIPNESPIGNGEINKHGCTLYSVIFKGTTWMFREDELQLK